MLLLRESHQIFVCMYNDNKEANSGTVVKVLAFWLDKVLSSNPKTAIWTLLGSQAAFLSIPFSEAYHTSADTTLSLQLLNKLGCAKKIISLQRMQV